MIANGTAPRLQVPFQIGSHEFALPSGETRSVSPAFLFNSLCAVSLMPRGYPPDASAKNVRS
jgi:hypothetical protein